MPYEVIFDEEKFSLITAHKKFVSAEPAKESVYDGIVTGNRDKAGEWETFTFEKVN